MSNAYMNFANHTPTQREQALPNQVKNNAGGFVFELDDVSRLERFLILGTDGGTYYQSEQDFTKMNVDFIKKMISTYPVQVMDVVRIITNENRALRKSPAIFTTALLMSELKNYTATNKAEYDYCFEVARKLVQEVCKTSTQLFEYVSYCKALGTLGSADHNAISSWYTSKDLDTLAYQMAKYRQRNGVTHADVLRLSHVKLLNDDLAKWANRYYKPEKNNYNEANLPDIIKGFLKAQVEGIGIDEACRLIRTYRLSWEMLPTSLLRQPNVWKTLFYTGQLRNQALIRNVTRLARIGAFNDLNFARAYADKLISEAKGLHPLNYLNALIVYQNGQIDRTRSGYHVYRTTNWVTTPIIVDALNLGFYDAFKHVVPSNKRIMLALDTSGSMSCAASGLEMSCAQLSAAMAMAIAKVEKTYLIKSFSTTFKDLNIAASMDLNTVMEIVGNQAYGGTDCSLPMTWAAKNKVEIDTFVVLTDNETWYGDVHPYKALENYRQATGINAGQIVVAATASQFSIANPNDPKTLDVVGGDANLPTLVSNFC